jgi:hypothetical protein
MTELTIGQAIQIWLAIPNAGERQMVNADIWSEIWSEFYFKRKRASRKKRKQILAHMHARYNTKVKDTLRSIQQ